MTLVKHEVAESSRSRVYGRDEVFQYQISGLPPGESALIAEFPQQGWRILRWNDEWHGNWTGSYPSPEAAIEALREQVQVESAV